MIVFKKPKALIARERSKLGMSKIWPEIISYLADFPDTDNRGLFALFGVRAGYGTSDVDFRGFSKAMGARGIKQIRNMQANKSVSMPEVHKDIQLTESFVQNFEQQRRKQGIVHLDRMNKIVGRIQESLEKESIKVAGLDDAGPLLSYHISNAKNAHSLAKDVYNIDGGSDGSNTKMNIAIITNFDPLAAAKQVTDI